MHITFGKEHVRPNLLREPLLKNVIVTYIVSNVVYLRIMYAMKLPSLTKSYQVFGNEVTIKQFMD